MTNDLNRVIKTELATGKEEILARFRDGEIDIEQAILALSDLTDKNVTKLADEHLAGYKDKITLVYTGANGRQELSPYSDLDVFILVEDELFDGAKIPAEHSGFQDSFQGFYYGLMDAGFDISSVVLRRVDHCTEDVVADQETWSQITDHRKGWGSDALYARLENDALKQVTVADRRKFIEDKFREYGKRLDKQDVEDHSTNNKGVTSTGRFTVIEPNVKNGYGGLRGFQTARWILKEQYGLGGTDLVEREIITKDDELAAHDAYKFLLTVRCHLHDISKAEKDQLESHYQETLASRMDYEDVESFMKDYFGATREIAHYTRMVCSDIAEQLDIEPPGGVSNEQIKFRSDELSDPIEIMNLFRDHVKTGHSIHHTAMQKVRQSSHMITDGFIKDPQANQMMLDILSHENAERTLRRMNTLGFLPSFIPELSNIRSLVQFDPYHAYTVDDHTLVAIGMVTALTNQEHVDLSPVASQLAQELTQEDREILSVALLLHDVHKGCQPGDVKAYSGDLVRKLGARLGLGEDSCETAAWLTENHLLLKHTSRFQDIEDTDAIQQFVDKIPDVKHLNLLRVMTMADTLALGPGRLSPHAAYRADSVYKKAHNIISGLTEQYNRKSFVLPEDYNEGVPYVKITPNEKIGADMLTVITADKPYLLENIMAGLEKFSTNVLTARVNTLPNGSDRAANIFMIQTEKGLKHSEQQIEKLVREVTDSIERDERIVVEPIPAQQDAERHSENKVFEITPRVEFSNELSDRNTTVKIIARNRQHLLHALTAVFNDEGMGVAHASIMTQGRRAVNVFQIHGDNGRKISTEQQTALSDALMAQISEEPALKAC